ncbi:MAG: hypothetical protein MN733_31745, partial [Nitrososphaera sp.]|nr:hypothetical protein [Nitrososphaera sp.]
PKPVHIDPPSHEVVARLEASHGFQYFVAYTDTGFHPSTLSIHKGETIRWTNNSSHDMWIVDAENPTSVTCDTTLQTQSNQPFNTCKALKPGDFWEHTFASAGTIQYMNKMKASNTGVVTTQ